jgi:hypothetical protein
MRSSGRLCQASTRPTVTSKDMGHWLEREFRSLGEIPQCYWPRLEAMRRAAYNSSGRTAEYSTDAAWRRHVRATLTELIDDLRVSLAGYRSSLYIFDWLESIGADPRCTKQQLLDELERTEAADLADLMEPVE